METVREQLVQRPTTKEDSYKKYGLFAVAMTFEVILGIVATVGGAYLCIIGVLLMILVGIGYFAILKSFNVEYEYCIAGAQLTVDKVINQSKRKTLCTIDLKAASAFYKSKKTSQEASVISAEGENYEDELTTYTIEFHDPKLGKTLLHFSPDERTLKMISPYLPQAI